MLLKPMRYKDYTWPHNPESCAVEYRRQIAAHKIPLGGWYLQDLGRTYRIFRGEGTFAGERAYEEFQTLAEVFDQTGVIEHRGQHSFPYLSHEFSVCHMGGFYSTVSAYFVTLELMEEPLPDYVRYRFSFWEDSTASGGLVEVPVEGEPEGGTDPEIPAGGWGAVHTVRKGETLWGIAWRYGVALTALIAANPQIKNPNLIYPGDQVRIP